jgi:hypothetical protein
MTSRTISSWLTWCPGSSRIRWIVHSTSCAVNSRPFTGGTSWNRTPWRRLNVQVLPSSEVFQLSARSPSSSGAP